MDNDVAAAGSIFLFTGLGFGADKGAGKAEALAAVGLKGRRRVSVEGGRGPAGLALGAVGDGAADRLSEAAAAEFGAVGIVVVVEPLAGSHREVDDGLVCPLQGAHFYSKHRDGRRGEMDTTAKKKKKILKDYWWEL